MTRSQSEHGATVVDEAALDLAMALEVRKALRLQYYVSLLQIRVHPVADLELVSELADVLRGHLRGTDIIGVTQEPCSLRVILVATPLQDLPAVIARMTRAVNRRLFRLGTHSSEVGLAIGGSSFPTPARTPEELVMDTTALASAAWEEGRTKHHYRLAPVSQ
jgi:hypothetical protein